MGRMAVQVEVAVMIYREELEDRGDLTKDELDARVASHRARLVAEATQTEPPSGRAEPSGREDIKKSRCVCVCMCVGARIPLLKLPDPLSWQNTTYPSLGQIRPTPSLRKIRPILPLAKYGLPFPCTNGSPLTGTTSTEPERDASAEWRPVCGHSV